VTREEPMHPRFGASPLVGSGAPEREVRARRSGPPARQWLAGALQRPEPDSLVLALALALAPALSACLVDAYDCSEHSDCPGSLCCINGRCVVPLDEPCNKITEADADGEGSDAREFEGCPPDPLPTGDCPEACTGGCAGGTCIIACDRTAPAACHGADGAIRCPDGRPCRVVCSGVAACQSNQIFCPHDASCEVRCEGLHACAGSTVRCGLNACHVSCADGAEYGPRIECGASCECSDQCDAPETDGG